MARVTLKKPDDWHVHVRDGDALPSTVPHTARQFARAIIMPNLDPPVTRTALALAYRTRVQAAVPRGWAFEPLMTLYLTDTTPAHEIALAKASGAVFGVKLYPAGATTHAEAGVTDLDRVLPTLAAMEEQGLPLLVHGEVVDPKVDIFDREAAFIDRVASWLLRRFPALRLVLEHITTEQAVDFVLGSTSNVAATITAHHLLYNRNALFDGGLRPHHYCLPVLKHERHRRALLEAITSGSPQFFLGTDSAPHPKHAKESACGCAGVFTAHAALELYAEAFAGIEALAHLEAFASVNGPRFYGLPVNDERITLVAEAWDVPQEYPMGGSTVVPLRAGGAVAWRILASDSPT